MKAIVIIWSLVLISIAGLYMFVMVDMERRITQEVAEMKSSAKTACAEPYLTQEENETIRKELKAVGGP